MILAKIDKSSSKWYLASNNSVPKIPAASNSSPDMVYEISEKLKLNLKMKVKILKMKKSRI